MPKYQLIVDLATDRIVFFTADLEQQLYTDEHCSLALYDSELPLGMTQRNSWNYVFRNQRLTNTVVPKPAQELLELNRESMIKTVNLHHSELKQLSFSDQLIMQQTLKEAMTDIDGSSKWIELYRLKHGLETYEDAKIAVVAHVNSEVESLYRLEKLKVDTITKLKMALTNNEIFIIRDEFLETVKKT